ncbi:MAG: hypothetical protein ACF8K1_03520 [Phycisphaerales bacterium JB047]
MSVMHTPNSVTQLSRAARRAILLRLVQNEMGRVLIWTLSVVIVLLLIDRLQLGGQFGPWWLLIFAAVLVAAVWAIGRAWVKIPSSTSSAGVLDERLGLSSRLRSAIELARGGDDQASGFIELALRDADALATGIDAHAAQPDAETQSWWWSGLLIMVIAGTGFWMPTLTQAPKPPSLEPPTRALAQIESTQELTDELANDESTPEFVREELRELESLREELEQGVTNEQEADARTAAKLDEIADALEDESEAAREQAKAISESIEAAQNQAEFREEQWDPRVDDFAESLRDQRFDEAADQIEALNDQLKEMTPEERDRIAQQLEDLANAVEPDEPSEPTQTEEASTPEPQRELSESLREQAERVREKPEKQADQAEQDPSQPNQQEEQGQGESQERDEPEGSESEPGQEGHEPQSQPQDQSNQEQGESEQEQQGQGESGENASEQGEPRKGGESEQGQDQPQEGMDQSSAQQQEGEPEAEEQGQEQQQGQDQDQEQGQEQAQEQGQEDGGGEPREVPEEGQGDSDESLEERLRKMSEQQQRSRENERNAERLREQARRLTSPEDRPEGDEVGQSGRMPEQPEDQQRPGGAGDGERDPNTEPTVLDQNQSTSVPIDARDKEGGSGGEPVGKWYGPEGERPAPGQSSETAQRFRRASEQAQRAIDEQQVPRRYRHLVREAFERVKKRADAIEGGGTIAPQGQDAVPSMPSEGSGNDG